LEAGLEDEGFNVTLSFDGSSGLRQAEMHAFDIVLLDVMLPALELKRLPLHVRLCGPNV